MNIRLLLLLSVLAVSAPGYAQKLYKIVDEEGNVSFSQYPPAAKKENVKVDNITVSGGAQSSVTESLDGKYCGKIKLPDKSNYGYSMNKYVKRLDKTRASWRQQMDSLTERVDKSNQNAIKNQSRYNSSYHSKRYQESIESNSERLRDLRCALDWADDELKGTHEFVADNKSERARLEKIKGDLQTKLNAKCGALAAYDPSAPGNAALRKSWYNCSDSYRTDISRVERAMRDL